MQQAGEGRYRVLEDIALPSLESVVKSSSRLPTLKSIVFTSVPVLGSSTAALSLLLGNVVIWSLLEELELYKCGMVSKSLLAIDNHLHCWPRLTSYSGCGRTTSTTLPMTRHGMQFIHAVFAHGGINMSQFDGAKVPSGSPVLKAVSYDYGKAQ